MNAEENADHLLKAGVLFHSSEENLFFTGGHVGLGEFDLTEVNQEHISKLSALLENREIELGEKQFSNACKGALGIRDDDFNPYWV